MALSKQHLSMRPASLADLPKVMEIVRHTVVGMQEAGNDQWDSNYPLDDRFLTDIENAALYLAISDSGNTLGFITIDEEQADEYASLSWQLAKPLVMHRVAVHPDAKGQGVASFMEKHAVSIARAKAKDSIRVDTHSTNKPMQSFLEQCGYRKIGEMDYHGKDKPYFCYEKPL